MGEVHLRSARPSSDNVSRVRRAVQGAAFCVDRTLGDAAWANVPICFSNAHETSAFVLAFNPGRGAATSGRSLHPSARVLR